MTEQTQLHHGARILLGNHHLYRLNCPKPAGETANQVNLVDYEQAMKEISLKELDKGIYISIVTLESIYGSKTHTYEF